MAASEPPMAADGRVSLERLEYVLKQIRANIGSSPQEAQDDIETFARSFRNQLAAGHAASVALMLVSAELAVEATKARLAERGR